jgi:hypothetical protein
MDFMRGMVSALMLTAWMASLCWFLLVPTSGWAFLSVGLVTAVIIGWWQHLKDSGSQTPARDGRRWSPPFDRSKNRFTYGWDDPVHKRGDRD